MEAGPAGDGDVSASGVRSGSQLARQFDVSGGSN
ncbi:uncharacterized protein G2W53_020593 [Senna tora]|uniref:Uncharacterized protein n=1 Tax=Senna tora TaxID=362788 RepID=A0A834WSF4_9FABA|nr:uncharacterized protein G2W53_020593 [Senna tora]